MGEKTRSGSRGKDRKAKLKDRDQGGRLGILFKCGITCVYTKGGLSEDPLGSAKPN